MPRFPAAVPTNSKPRDGKEASGGSSAASNSGGGASWTPPLWLTKQKRVPQARSLTIPIPPVPIETRKAIQKHIAKQQPPYFKQQAQINQLHAKLLTQQEKVRHAQHKLERLEEDKAERIQEIKVVREEEKEESLKRIEKNMQSELEEEFRKKEEEFKRDAEKEMQAAKEQFKKEQAAEEEKELELRKQQFEEEQKKKGEQGNEEKEATAAAELEIPISKKLEEEHEKVMAKINDFKETKKEMVWLLKQVINAENKRKAADTAIPKKKLKPLP